MFHLTRYKYWFFLISGLIIVPGILALSIWGLNLGIDFTKGDNINLRFARSGITTAQVQQAFAKANAQDLAVYAATDSKGAIPASQFTFITFDRPIGKAEEAAVLSRLGDAKYNLPPVHKDHTLYTIAGVNGKPATALMVVYFDKGVTSSAVRAALQNLPATDAPPVTTSNPTGSSATSTATPTTTATATTGSQTGSSSTSGTTYPVSVSAVDLGENDQTYQVNTQTFLNGAQLDKIVAQLNAQYGPAYVQSLTEVGPSIAAETARNAFLAVLVAALFILAYIAFAFRKVGSLGRSIRFGASAIIALLHDVLVVMGLWAIFGHFFDFKVDTLFLTAVLTVIGFSVHDTIVVFDRIRENLSHRTSESFETIVDASLIQTLSRSLNTSLTVLFTLSALTLFGGASIREFTLALLLGIASGTFSSIFNASMILVVWENKEYKNWFGRGRKRPGAAPQTRRRELAGARA